MKLILLSLMIFTLQAFAQNLKLEKSSKDHNYYLVGDCEEAKKEILQIDEKAVTNCTCQNDVCKTNLSSALPKRIQKALSFVQKEFGPNCWNSVLYAKGVQDTFKASEEMNYFLASPFCEEVSGEPRPKDIITEYDAMYSNGDPNRIPTFIHNVHSFLSLSDTLAFNKNGPEIEKPYEIVRKEDWYKEFNIKDECRFTGIEKSLEAKCNEILINYRCSNLRGIKEKWLAYQKQSPEVTKLARKLAKDKLKFPSFKKLPHSVLQKMQPFTQGQDLEYNEQDAKFVYLMASPDMKLPSHIAYREAILEMRKLGIYSQLPAEERLMWINVFFRGADF